MMRNGFILNPPDDLKPMFRLSPFSTADVVKNRLLADSKIIDSYFDDRFGSKSRHYTQSGREAINIALSFYDLQPEDCVTILTTSGNRYVSGCVTQEIERFCHWSRNIEANSKILFVIHEFGYPFEEIGRLKQYNIPIVEDCAYSFLSKDRNDEMGNVGDFVVFSFPKIFPVQSGGLLVSNYEVNHRYKLPGDLIRYIENILSFNIPSLVQIKDARNSNYNYLNDLFNSIQLTGRFETRDNIVPGVFMFKDKQGSLNLQELKKFMCSHGIECSVFYGEDSFYMPVHQNLSEDDLLYFFEVVKYFKTELNGNL
jgi:DegT/DnrJ/EryC1/StrS aminotransferase family